MIVATNSGDRPVAGPPAAPILDLQILRDNPRRFESAARTNLLGSRVVPRFEERDLFSQQVLCTRLLPLDRDFVVLLTSELH